MKTLTVDDSKRIRIPDAKPRQVFAYTNNGDGTITLTPEQHGNPAEYERALKAVGGDYSKIRVAPQPNPYGI